MPLQPLQLGMDADLQHEPESVPDVAKPVLEGRDGSAIWHGFVRESLLILSPNMRRCFVNPDPDLELDLFFVAGPFWWSDI